VLRRRILRGLWTVTIAGTVVLATPLPTKSDLDGRPRYSKQEIRRAITFYAKRYRLEPALLRAVIKVESDFRPSAVSRKGAVGLMQLTPDTAVTLKVADPYDPIQNIRGGAKQLRHLLTLYEGDLRLTLAAYNAGVHRVKGGKIPRIRETRRYVRNVLRYYDTFRRADGIASTPKAAMQGKSRTDRKLRASSS
jgi:soluble lytic murein transglycosylase-like protein